MNRMRRCGGLLGMVLVVALALVTFGVPVNAAHEVTAELKLHVSGDDSTLTKKYTVPIDSAVTPVSHDTKVVTVTQESVEAVTGSATGAKITRVLYQAVAPGTTTVDLFFDNNKHNAGPVKVTVEDHKWNSELTVDEESTCIEHGIGSIHCSVCDAIKPGSEKELELAKHHWSMEYTTDDEPTYFSKGVESRHCVVCDEIDESSIQSIPKLKLGRAKIKSAKNVKTRTIKVQMKMMEGPSGFDFSYSTVKGFPKGSTKTRYTKNTKVKLVNMKKGKTYYFRARAVKKEDGKKAKGKWSKVKKVRVTK